jgi:hypothetical protein
MLMKITDRLCWVIAAEFKVKYLLVGIEENELVISKRINRELKKHIKRFFNITHATPYTYVESVEQLITETAVDPFNKNTTATASVKIEFCVENPDNEPEKIGRAFVHLLFDTVNRTVKSGIQMCAIQNEIAITESFKGYIQLDNTVFVPIPE